MDLSKIKTASTRKEAGEQRTMGKSCLIFGPPKTGKTVLAGKLSKKFKVLYFDTENSRETFYAPNNAEFFNLDNIYVQPIFDTSRRPLAQEFFRDFFDGKKVKVCPDHGLKVCPACTANKLDFNEYAITDIPEDMIVVIDSASQLDISIQSKVYGGAGKNWETAKATFDQWAQCNHIWDNIGTTIQNCGNIPVKILMIHHQHKDDDNRMYPSVSTKNYGATYSKFFSHVIRTGAENRKYSVAVTAIEGKGDAGNRAGITSMKTDDDWFAMWGVT